MSLVPVAVPNLQEDRHEILERVLESRRIRGERLCSSQATVRNLFKSQNITNPSGTSGSQSPGFFCSRVEVLYVAVPLLIVPVPNVVLPSLNVTVPVANEGESVAVNVTELP